MTTSLRALHVLGLAFLLGATASEDLVYAPEEGLILTRSFLSEGTYSLDELRIVFNGEEFPHDGAPQYEVTSDETIVVTDELLSVEGGRPLELQRTFDELRRSVIYSTDAQDEDLEESSICDLEGSTVIFGWSEADEEYEVLAADDEEIDDQVLEDLIEDMDLRQLLPDEEVEPGDEWEIDSNAYARLMWPSGFLHFYPEDGEYDESERESDLEMVENLEGDGTVEFVEVREEDGISVAVLQVSFDVSSEASREIEGPDGSEATRSMSIAREVEGIVLWDIEGGHLLSAELEAEAELEVTEAGTIEGPEGQSAELEQTRSFSGTISYSITIE